MNSTMYLTILIVLIMASNASAIFSLIWSLFFGSSGRYKADTIALFTLSNCDPGFEYHCQNAIINEKAMRDAQAKNSFNYELCTVDVKNNASILFDTTFPFLQSRTIDMTGQCVNTNTTVKFYDRQNQTIFFTYVSFHLTRFISALLINTDFILVSITTELMYPAPLLDKDTFIYSYECSYELEVQKGGIKRIKTEYNMSYITFIYLKESANDLILANKSCDERKQSAFCFYTNERDYRNDCFKEIFVDLKSNKSVKNALNIIMGDAHNRVLITYGYGSSIYSFAHHDIIAPYNKNGTLFITSFERSLSPEFQIEQHRISDDAWYSMKVLRNIPGEHSINELFKYAYNIKDMLVDDELIFRALQDNGMIEKYKHLVPSYVPGFNLSTDEVTFDTWLSISLSVRQLVVNFIVNNRTNILSFIQHWKKANYLEIIDTKYLLTLPEFNPKEALKAKPYCNLTKPTCSKGKYLRHSFFKAPTWQNSYGWNCGQCPSETYKDFDGNEPCQSCLYPYKTNQEKTACYDPFHDYYISFDQRTVIFVFAVSLLSAFIITATLGIFIRHRATPVVLHANRQMSFMQLISHFVLAVAPLVMFIGKQNQVSCYMKPLVIGICFTVTVSVNLSKTQKLYVIFKTSLRRHSRLQVHLIGFLELLIVFIFALIDIAILFISFMKQPPKVTHVYHDEELIREITCNNSDAILIQLSFVLVLVLCNTVQAVRARNLPSHFRETMYVIYTSFISILMLPAVAAIYFFQNKESEKSMVLFVSVELLNAIHFSFIYLYKVYIILFRPDVNTRESFNRKRQEKIKMSFEKEITE